MFDSFKRSCGTVLGTIVGLIAGSYLLDKLNTYCAKESENRNEEEDFVEESN